MSLTSKKLESVKEDYESTSEIYYENDWGWFVDTDSQEEESLKLNKIIKPIPIHIPQTISKLKKSHFNLENQYYEKSETNASWLVHASCLVSIIIIIML